MAVISFSMVYVFMDSPVPEIMQLVCAAAQKPPKEVHVIQRKKAVCFDSAPSHRREIPLVISREGSRRKRNRKCLIPDRLASDIRMEKSIIYPPTLVIISNPFIIQVSTIFSTPWGMEDFSTCRAGLSTEMADLSTK